ncbi:hypothetical protein NDU88_007769 [Pleurodeles waltl]|uniref:Uncharacterized protein n=1 Tax=Pleurodeles waltl TaxID=8319 RepID=A0AAV7RSV2_PLEWA|nr:hypothetical protein NDU88_007769 [Pleurodeles waltl]
MRSVRVSYDALASACRPRPIAAKWRPSRGSCRPPCSGSTDRAPVLLWSPALSGESDGNGSRTRVEGARCRELLEKEHTSSKIAPVSRRYVHCSEEDAHTADQTAL